jgi:hypothetical protein
MSNPIKSEKREGQNNTKPKTDRKDRLALALKENIKRRKKLEKSKSEE